ncbi:hypothetical protein ACOMHN_047591 [Nucella lapillus]
MLDQEIKRLETFLALPMEDYPKLSEELLYLLPESKGEGTPDFQRRRRHILERCNSISDGGEGVSFAKEEHDDVLRALVTDSSRSQSQDSPPMGKRHSAQDSVPLSTFKRLRLKNRSFSVSHAPTCKWRTRLKTKQAAAPGPRRKYCRNNAMDGEDSSMSFSSPPSSPGGDGERGMDKSRFAALLGEELVDSGSLSAGGMDVSLLSLPACGRARSYSASCDRAPTIDKITQTSFADSPQGQHKRLGRVYRVNKLEVIEMEDSPARCPHPASPVKAPCRWTLSGPSISSPSEDRELLSALEGAGSTSVDSETSLYDQVFTRDSQEGEKSNKLRPDSFPDELGPLSSGSGPPRSRSPFMRRANAVHFSPYNEVRFVNRTDISDSFLQAAAADSPTVKSPPDSAPSHKTANASNASYSDNQPGIPVHDHASESSQPSSSESTQSPPSLVSPRKDFYISPSNQANSNFKAAQTAIENERRKRIRKLQHDLKRIQRELQDLDELEYDVTEV